MDYDNEINKLKSDRMEMLKKVPLIQKTEIVNTSITQYCEGIKLCYKKCNDFETKRQFLLDYVDHITLLSGMTESLFTVQFLLRLGKPTTKEEKPVKVEVRWSLA